MSFTFKHDKIFCWKEAVLNCLKDILAKQYRMEDKEGRCKRLRSYKFGVSEAWVSHGEKLQVSFVFRSEHWGDGVKKWDGLWENRNSVKFQTTPWILLSGIYYLCHQILASEWCWVLSEDEVSSFKERVRELIFRVDPVSRALRRFRTVQRRVYNVTKPNALW